MRAVRRILGILVVLAIGFGVGWAWPIIVRPPLVVGQDAISSAATTKVQVKIENAGGRVLVARPPSGVAEQQTLVIIYPGGLVRPQAYEWLARREAALGRLAVIPEFSFDLAVLDSGRADALIAKYGAGRKVVLIGHSLGGAMAAQYLSDKAKQGQYPVAGLILMAAYPADGIDLTGAKFAALSLRAENDTVAAEAKVEGGLKQLPKGTRLEVVDGAVHAFFGRYGPQAGDGVPTVTREAAQTQIGAYVDDFIASLPS
ncbi:MAG: dienelactone hydrolase family protein [Propionibacteriaceae bacterium]|nr:dienelactone hydrolase family protein [Propionibacteriaceae bacterium]